MLITFIFVLSAVTINGESIEQDGLRKSRQLDLGLQDIRTDLTTTIQEPANSTEQDVTDGYLPPTSSSLSPKVVGSQSQKAFDFKSLNSLEKESELCKPPFDRESCNSKESSVFDSVVTEPSRELMPPFNDLEKDINIKATTTLELKTEEAKSTEDLKESLKTTIMAKLLNPVPTRNTAGITSKPQALVPANKEEATNELRSYLPPQPEYSAAAQTNIAVTRPPNHNSDNNHDNHNHHHDENFNICTDAFHSFLCAPLKVRKRITGALPSNLLGSSSYINYQKTLAKFDRETAPSNEFRNEYLPPKASPADFSQSAYSSSFPTKKSNIITTTTTTRPNKVFYKPSNSNGRIQNTVFVKPAFSNQATDLTAPASATSTKSYSGVASNLSNSKAPAVNSASGSPPPKIAVFSSLSSNENSFYLPPKTNSQSSASFTLTSENFLPITSTIKPLPSTFVSLPAITTFSPLPSNSIFSSQKPKQIFTTTSKPFSTPAKAKTTVSNVQTSSSASLSSNNIYFLPSHEFVSSSRPSTTTVKPNLIAFKFSEQYSSSDRSYLPPETKEQAAAQISSAVVPAAQSTNPVHHGRDLCTDPFHSFLCASSKPRKKITGELPLGFKPESSNIDEVGLKSEPSSRDDKPLESAPAQSLEYKYPKPTNSLPSNAVTSTQPPSTNYFYPKPDIIFSLPTQQNAKVASSSSITKRPDLTLNPTEASVVLGYQYSKPDKIFSSPAKQESTRVTTTTASSPTTGYTYPKPQKSFSLPTEQKEIRQKPKPKTPSVLSQTSSLSTNQVKGYQYPKPDQSLKSPEKKGYSYPKPEKRLELPTESRPKSLLPQNNFNLDTFGHSGSAEFIPVNKIEYKRAEPSKLLMGLRRFGERMKKRERQAQLLKRQLH